MLQIRAFADWPGTTASLVVSSKGKEPQIQTVKLIRAEVDSGGPVQDTESRPVICIEKSSLKIFCGQDSSGGVLSILEVQPIGKKVMAVAAFINGLSNKSVSLHTES